MLPLEHPDRIDVAFDDHRLVANAGLILPVTLAHHLGLGVPRQLYLPVGVNQFCRFTSLAWTRCWAALVR